MPFKVGRAKTGGTKKGFKHTKTLEFEAVLAKHNFNPAEAMLEVYKESIDNYQEYKQRFLDNRTSPMEDNAHKFLKIAGDMARELGSYLYPKRKAIEQNVNVSVEADQAQTVGLLYDKVKAIFEQPKDVIAEVVSGSPTTPGD